jgi:peroxin-10
LTLVCDFSSAVNNSSTNLTERQRKWLSNILPKMKDFVDILQRVHLAIFYFSGYFYHLAKRLTNTTYVRLSSVVPHATLDLSLIV